MEWIHDEYSVVEKHVQTMLQLLEFGMDLEIWRTGADREYSSYSDCGRDHRSLNIPVTHIVEDTQIVEEITEVSKSSIEWGSIPNIYFVGIKVFLG